MRPGTLNKLKKVEMAPHTIDDSVRIAQNGVTNLTQMQSAFPDAYLEDIHGVGRVWVASVGPERLSDFELAIDQYGAQTLVPFAVVSTIRVYLPSGAQNARMKLSELKARGPEAHQAVLDLIRAR